MISLANNPHRLAFLATGALVTAVLATMAFSTVEQLYDGRRDRVKAAGELMREQSDALAEHMAKNLGASDIIADAIEALAIRRGLGEEPLRFDPPEVTWIDEHVGPNLPIAAIAIYDRTGAMRYQAGMLMATPRNVRDRSAFRLLMDSGIEHLTEKPTIDPKMGRWSIATWARIVSPAGEFLGAARALVQPVETYRLFAQNWGPRTVVAITDLDGRIMAIRPPAGTDSAAFAGRPLNSVAAFQGLPARIGGGESTRTFDDGTALVVRSHLLELPVAIIVARTYDDILAEWRSAIFYDCAPVAGAALLGIGLLAIAWYYGRQRDRVESALEESRAEIETLYDTAPVGLTLIDRDLRYVRINQKMHEISSARADLHIGRTVREVVPHIADQVEPIYRQILETGQPVLDVPVTQPPTPEIGYTRHFLSSYHPVMDRHGRPIGINAVIQDVTELKRMHDTHARLMAVIDASPDFVGFSDAERRPTYINRAGRRMIGLGSDEDLAGLGVLDFYAEKSRQKFIDEVRPASRRDGMWQGELTMIARDGHEIFVYQTSVAHLGSDGEPDFFATFIRDISAQKRAEEKLTRREERFRALIENASDLISVIDTKGNITFQSPSSQILGYTPDELAGHNFAEFVHPDDLEMCQRTISELSIDIGGTAQAEFRVRHKDGQWRLLQASGRNAMHRRAVKGIVINARDITEIRQAEEELRHSEERFRALIEKSTDFVSILDADGVYKYYSPSSRLLGYEPEELVGHHCSEFIHPDDIQTCLAAMARGKEQSGKTASAEIRKRHKDGSWRILEATGRNALDDPNIKGFVVNARDVTEVRKAEATRARLAAALDGAAEGFALFDPEDRLIYVNPEFRRLARSVEDLLKPGTHYADMMREAAKRGDIPQAQGQIEEWLAAHMVRHRTSMPSFEVQRGLDGIWVRMREQKMPDGSTFIGHTDITEEKQRTEELRQAQKLEVVGKLTAGVAHDFNNLLTAVIGNLDFLSDSLPADSKLVPFVRTAMTASQRGARLVQQLLSFARKQPLDARVQELGDVVGGMADLLRTTVGSRVVFETVIDDGLWPCKVDSYQLEHALLNIATNARDAMPDGGRFTVVARNLHAKAPFQALQGEMAAGDYVSIAAIDTGIGMSEDIIARAIEPFFTTKEVGKGSGLGLSMISGFAKQSGGDIMIQSAPGKGTRIELILPRAEAASGDGSAAEDAATSADEDGTTSAAA